MQQPTTNLNHMTISRSLQAIASCLHLLLGTGHYLWKGEGGGGKAPLLSGRCKNVNDPPSLSVMTSPPRVSSYISNYDQNSRHIQP